MDRRLRMVEAPRALGEGLLAVDDNHDSPVGHQHGQLWGGGQRAGGCHNEHCARGLGCSAHDGVVTDASRRPRICRIGHIDDGCFSPTHFAGESLHLHKGAAIVGLDRRHEAGDKR